MSNEINLNISIPIEQPSVKHSSVKQTCIKTDINNDKGLNTLIEMLNSKKKSQEDKRKDKKINDSWLLFTLDPIFKKEISKIETISDINYEKFKKLYLNNEDSINNIYDDSIKNQDFLI